MRSFVMDLPAWAEVTAKRRAHIERVGGLVSRWADAMAIDDRECARWFRAVNLHDALKDAEPTRLRTLAPDAWGADSLRHGPAAAVVAAERGEADTGVLDAVRYHSVGYAGWDRVGRILYLADFLEPGRTHPGLDLAERVAAEPLDVLRRVVRYRLEMTLAKRHRLLTVTVDFWNWLCDGSSSF